MIRDAEELFALARAEAARRGAEDVEMWIGAGESSLTRFANNGIHQNVADASCAASIRVQLGQRTARVSTNRLAHASIAAAAAKAVELAKAAAEDPELPPMAEAQRIEPVARWDAATAALTAERRAEAVREAIAVMEGAGHVGAGIFSNESSCQVLLNSRGVHARHEETGAVFSVTATARDSSGWAKASGVAASSFNPVELARRAAEKATRSAAPRRLEPGRYRVLLEPAAVLDLVGQIFGDCSRTALDEERSFLNERMEEQLFGGNITIRDDVRHPLQDGAPFDGEGVPRRSLTLFKSGRPCDVPCGRTAARRNGCEPTGHGLALPNDTGEAVSNIVIEGGAETREGLLRKLGTGLLVTRLWYIREVDPFRKVMTGMTRDGTFFVDGGEVAYGVHNFRFNVSVIDLLNAVEAMTAPERASGEEAFDMVVPAMLASEFPFTEVTLF